MTQKELRGERLHEFRLALGISLKEFSARMGVTSAAISAIEYGTNSLTEKNMRYICKEFNCNYDWLKSGEGEMFKDDWVEQFRKLMESDDENTLIIKNIIKTLLHCDESEILAINNIFKLYEKTKEAN